MENTQSCDDIYQTLEREIIGLSIKPGQALSENALCARFGVSRTPVRAVLQRLQENGLVHIRPYKGTTVTLMDYDIISQLIYQRVAVESMVLRDFARQCTALDIELLRDKLRLMEEEGARPRVDPARFHRRDSDMHQVWFAATRKLYLWESIQKGQPDYSRFKMLDIVEARNIPDVLAEHREMLDIVENKRLDDIEPLMERHLYGGVRRLGGKLFTDFKDYFVQPAP